MGDSGTNQLRIDKLLWYLRLAPSRSLAQAMIEAGHIRLEGRRITRSSALVHPGQHLVIPLGREVAVIRILTLPTRRGPAPEAQSCYTRIDSASGPSSSADAQALPQT